MKNNINNILNFIANRFLFSKKSQTLVNVISLISTISLTFIMMLLVFIISIFNGFQNIIESQYSVFYPDIKITSENNFFNSEEFNLSNIKYINSFSEVIEIRAVLKNQNSEQVVKILGVDSSFYNISDHIIPDIYEEGRNDVFICSYETADLFSMQVGDFFNPCKIYIPNSEFVFSGLNFEEIFNVATSYPINFFNVQSEDNNIIIMKKKYVADFIGKKNQITSIYLDLAYRPNIIESFFKGFRFYKNTDENKKNSLYLKRQKKELHKNIGEGFIIETFFEQNKLLFKMIKIEKLAIYLLMLLVVFLISFNIVGNLIVLITEKKQNIKVFHDLGFSSKNIIDIFKKQGQKLIFIGAFSGSVLGFILVYLQSTFGFLKMGPGFIIQAYPVRLQTSDIIFLNLIVILVGYLGVFLTSKIYKKQLIN